MIKAYKTKASFKNAILYKGPSLIDGSPVVVIALKGSTNRKTGGMIQTYVLADNGLTPLQNSKAGTDRAICGDCKHRGKASTAESGHQALDRTCYVNLSHGPSAVWRAYKAGKYPRLTNSQLKDFAVGYTVRIGSYGDGAAIDPRIWSALLAGATGHTGYSHQHSIDFGQYKTMMYSADSEQEAAQAHQKGYRTFRVIPLKTWQDQGKAALMQNEINCPASKEAGQRVQCNECKLCGGSNQVGKNIAIVDHGPRRLIGGI